MAPSHLIPLFDMCTKGFYTLTYIGGVNWTLRTADGEAIASTGSFNAGSASLSLYQSVELRALLILVDVLTAIATISLKSQEQWEPTQGCSGQEARQVTEAWSNGVHIN